MTELEAIDKAAKHAKQQGWPWLEPVQCQRRTRWFFKSVYVIHSNADKRGTNVLVTIDAVNGEIRDARFLCR